MSSKSPLKTSADNLAEVSARIFERRMRKNFAEKMDIEFDPHTEERLAQNGYKHIKVFQAGYEKAVGGWRSFLMR